MTNQQDNEQVRAESPRKQGMFEALGARLGRDTGIYVIGGVITFVLALVSIIVTTRFLSPAEFGELALLLVFAAFLTITYNVGTLQGTFMWVFGSAGEEEVEDEAQASAAGTKRRALGTGLILTAGIAVIGTGVFVAVSPWAAQWMLGDSGEAELIMLAAVSGAAGAIWRLVSNILRMERKPRAYVALNSVRPVLVVGTVIPLVASGGGVEGAVLGTAIGSVLSVLVGLGITRRSFVLRLDRNDLRMIARRGLIYVPIVISIWIAQNVDIYTLSWFAPEDEVGVYRLANRVGAFLDYFSAALFMAWTPLRRTSTFAGAVAERGQEVLGGKLLTYFALAGFALVLLMTVAADTLVRIAPPAYAAAAPLIPLMGAAFLSYGFFVAVYRLMSFPRKMMVYVASAMGSAAVFLATALVLVPWLGAYGAGLSVITGFVTGTAVMTYLSQRGPRPLQIEYGRIGAAFALAGACFCLARGVAPLAGSWQPPAEVLAFVLYPMALIVLGVFTREDVRAIGRVTREILPRRAPPPEIERRVRHLQPDALSVLEGVVVHHWPVSKVADQLGAQAEETGAQLVLLLRGLVHDGDGTSQGTEQDQRIAEYLFSEMPVAERDALANTLWSEGVDPSDLHDLERAIESLQRLPKRVWTEAKQGNGPTPSIEVKSPDLLGSP
jgi:O-antigen/teichoic acid export membrane protein